MKTATSAAHRLSQAIISEDVNKASDSTTKNSRSKPSNTFSCIGFCFCFVLFFFLALSDLNYE